MWVGNLLAANRSGRLPFSARTGIDDHTRLTKKGSPRTDTRRRPPSSERRKAPESARQRRVALSRMASKMGCKSYGEFTMARSTSAPVRKRDFDAGLADRLSDLDPVAFGKAFNLLLGAHHRRIFASDLEQVV